VVELQLAAEEIDSRLGRSKRLDNDWGMANYSTISVEEEQNRSPLLGGLP
jgi:hypothetical protein